MPNRWSELVGKASETIRDPESRKRLTEQASRAARAGKAALDEVLDDVRGKDGQIKKRKVVMRALRPMKTARGIAPRAASAAYKEARTQSGSDEGDAGSNLQLSDDPDVAAILTPDGTVNGDLLGPADQERVQAFLDGWNRAVEDSTVPALQDAGNAGMLAYQDRDASMPLGFEKFLIANIGICGTQLWDEHHLGPESDQYLVFALQEILNRGWRPDGDHTVLGAHCGYITATLAENGYMFERAPNTNL